MGFRKNWFVALACYLYMAAATLILIFGVTQFADKKKYPYLSQLILVIGFFVVLMFIVLICYLVTRPRIVAWASGLKKASPWIETALVVLVLGIGLALRIFYIRKFPLAMESDYKFYYDVARLIKEGTLLTESNNEYIALFPHTFGYSFVLSKVISIFGSDPQVCLYFNAVISVLTSLICYGIGKKTVGSVAGIVALVLTCFWPSQIIFSNINGAEAVFTFLLYGAAYIFLHIMKKYNGKNSRAVWPILLSFLVGVVLGLASAIRPMSLILLLAILICLLFLNYKLTYKENINELSFASIFLSKGWMRLIVILAGYLLCGQIINGNITRAIEMNIAGSGAIGYSLMVGLDSEHDGGYSEKSMNILYENYNRTKSADEVNQVCLDIALEAVKSDPLGTVELLAKKYYLVWADDNYATTTNIVTMNNQGLLSQHRVDLFQRLAGINQIYYLFTVFLSILGVYYLLRIDNNAQIFPVFFIGAIILHMLVEMQNRYHYYLLQNFAILAAVGVGMLFKSYLNISKDKIAPVVTATAPDQKIKKPNTKKEEANKPQLTTIDVLKAIKEGHIIITATKAYEAQLPEDKWIEEQQGVNDKSDEKQSTVELPKENLVEEELGEEELGEEDLGKEELGKEVTDKE